MSTGVQRSSKKRGCLKWLGVVVGALCVLVIVGLVVVGFRGSRAKAALRTQYPPPGEMVDVGGYRLHLDCQGTGAPTVVLLPGAGDFSLSWTLVQPEVAKTTRVCAYDPGGFGWSELGPQPPTVANMVTELHTLLAEGGVEAPYVLVAHSISGIYARAFASLHPEEVVGMVLVDPSHEDQADRVAAAIAERGDAGGGSGLTNKINAGAQDVILALLAAQQPLGILALSPQVLAGLSLPPLPEDAKPTYMGVMLSSDTYFAALRHQYASTEDIAAEVHAMNLTSLGDMPLVVLSARKVAVPPGFVLSAEEVVEMQATMQAELAALSSRGEVVYAEESSHYVQLIQPELVIEAVARVLQAQ